MAQLTVQIETFGRDYKSPLSWLFFVFAIYSTCRSLQVLTCTPSVASSSPDNRLFNSRRRLFFLHGFNLAVRWGFGLIWLVALNLKEIQIPGDQVLGYIQGLDYKTICMNPLESDDRMDRNYYQGLLLIDVLVVIFDMGFSKDCWDALTEASAIPSLSKDVELFTLYPFADLLSRSLAMCLDAALAATATTLILQQTNVNEYMDYLDISVALHKPFLNFVVVFFFISCIVRCVCRGKTIGKFFAGTEVVESDGKPLSMMSILQREVFSLFCSAFLMVPFVVFFNDENAIWAIPYFYFFFIWAIPYIE